MSLTAPNAVASGVGGGVEGGYEVLFDSLLTVMQCEPANLLCRHVVSLPLLPGASGPLASRLCFFHRCLSACAHLPLKTADMISHSLINWKNQSRRGVNCYWTSHNLLCDKLCSVSYTVHLQPL